jgi:two-component system OmpR family response regulator
VTDCKLIHRHADTRRALVLQAELVQPLVGTLERGSFVVRVARTLAEAETILASWRPDLAVVDMDHDEGPALLLRLGASNSLQCRSGTPVLGLTHRGDLPARLRAFTLGVDDILAVPFAPEELLARAIVISRAAPSTDVWARPV